MTRELKAVEGARFGTHNVHEATRDEVRAWLVEHPGDAWSIIEELASILAGPRVDGERYIIDFDKAFVLGSLGSPTDEQFIENNYILVPGDEE